MSNQPDYLTGKKSNINFRGENKIYVAWMNYCKKEIAPLSFPRFLRNAHAHSSFLCGNLRKIEDPRYLSFIKDYEFKDVKIGNLLNINKSKEPNLLSFEPTKQGLKNRGKELEGLFGGRKTRRRRNHKRKTRRSRK